MPNWVNVGLYVKIWEASDDAKREQLEKALTEKHWERLTAGLEGREAFFALPVEQQAKRLDAEAKRQLEEYARLSQKREGDAIEQEGTEVFNFATVVPIPDEVRAEQKAKRDAAVGIDKCMVMSPEVRVWSTTGTSEVSIGTDGATFLSVDMLTPWSPPTAYVKAATKRYPLLVFLLISDELNANFYTELKCALGVVVSEEEGDCAFWQEGELSHVDLQVLESEYLKLSDGLAKPDTDFAAWCERTGRYEVYRPVKRSRSVSPPAQEVEVAE